MFIDYDSGGDISYANNRNNINTGQPGATAGIYSETLAEILFSTENAFDPQSGTGVIGKTYLGTADHLFRLNNDPTSEHYGYYFYDSKLNAASYNQSDGRFYVYDYLERTSDSERDGGADCYSDFLPLNSPYANLGGNTPVPYTYDGDNGEFAGVTHYRYDAKYDTSPCTVDNVATNFFFGMRVDMNFYLPNAPGETNADGETGNRDLYGKEMHFKFSGDDDVWVLVDGELVLDIGGIHGVVNGDINFSTGIVTVDGTQTNTVYHVPEGEHVLTVLYLERGSSKSNCAIYTNLAPRFNLTIQKEDVLTQEVLNGAEFTIYSDLACTQPVELWATKEDYDAGLPATSTFSVADGAARMWGFSAGKTYYIKETKPPDDSEYGCSRGIICMTLDVRGHVAYHVKIENEIDEDGNEIDSSNGFNVYGFRIDEATQQAYIVISNAPSWVKESTTVEAYKVWNDDLDHSGDTVTVYLTVTDPDGTVRRLREIPLCEEYNWRYIWTHLPKYYEDGVTEIQYGVEEAYVPGYSATVERVETLVMDEIEWASAFEFVSGELYLLKQVGGSCLATASETSHSFVWMEEEAAKESPLALWTAAVDGNGAVTLTNGNGAILTFNGVSGATLDGGAMTEGTDYTVSASGNTFTVAFTDATIANGGEIVLSYSATLNENAVIVGSGNVNETWLTYGENNSTAHSATTTYTYAFDLVKTDSDNKLLGGAQFKLYTALTGGEEFKVVKVDDTTYRPAGAGEEGVAIDVAGGKVRLVGFDSDDYYLEETDAPVGYNKLAARQKLTVENANLDATVEVSGEDTVWTAGGVQVVNKAGSVLPETGGLGTTLFIVGGGMAVLFAGVLLFAKKRMAQIAE